MSFFHYKRRKIMTFNALNLATSTASLFEGLVFDIFRRILIVVAFTGSSCSKALSTLGYCEADHISKQNKIPIQNMPGPKKEIILTRANLGN